MREFRPHHLPTNSHRCMLRDSGTSQSDDSLDEDINSERVRSHNVVRPAQICIRKPIPLALTQEIYSASNAIKFICHQMRNQEDYNTVSKCIAVLFFQYTFMWASMALAQ